MAYTPLRHAHVGETAIHGDRLLPVEWVLLSRWHHESGAIEYCVEYLDGACEIAGKDASFDSLADAERHAAAEFSVGPDDWHDGFPGPA
jgi:hypothetical protein